MCVCMYVCVFICLFVRASICLLSKYSPIMQK